MDLDLVSSRDQPHFPHTGRTAIVEWWVRSHKKASKLLHLGFDTLVVSVTWGFGKSVIQGSSKFKPSNRSLWPRKSSMKLPFERRQASPSWVATGFSKLRDSLSGGSYLFQSRLRRLVLCSGACCRLFLFLSVCQGLLYPLLMYC